VTFERITVFGAGTMGAGITLVCAGAGAQVTLCDASPEAIKRAQKLLENELKDYSELRNLSREDSQAVKTRIQFQSGLFDCAESDLIVEAITEKLDVKQELFSRIDAQLPLASVIASATNTLSITTIAAKTRFPERVCGLHFFHPPTEVDLVEVIRGQRTAEDVVERCRSFIGELGKESVIVSDTPGFVVHRCTRPFFNEALRCLSEGLADAAAIDKILREGGGFKAGPFEQMDQIGLDVHSSITRALWEGYAHESRFRPHLIIRRMIEAGQLGRKTGRGFFEYRDVE